jgi:tripartite-type tricarboxylate transporter receptor subunit TctC
MFMRYVLALSLALCAIFYGRPSFSADSAWPDKPIRFIVPFPAGSAADTIARLIGNRLSEKLGQPDVIYNRDGASGEIGSTQIATSDPDGYTFGIATTTTLVTAPILNRRIKYDALKDFEPVAMVGYSPYVLVVYPDVPAKTIQDYIALAKEKPKHVSYSSEGEASLAHLAAELFSSMAGITLNQVPYKSSTQGVLDLLAGRIDSQFGILTTTRQYIKDGKLRALGVTTPQRIPELPDVPTISESGLPGYDVSLWLAVVAPAKTPKPIVEKLSGEINQVLARQDIRTVLSNQSIIVEPQSPAEMRSRIESDSKKWSDLAVKAGLSQ